MKQVNKKGQAAGVFQQLPTIAIVLGIAVVMFVIMTQVVQTLQDAEVTGTSGCNTTETGSCGSVFNFSSQGLNLFTNIGAQFGLLGTITILGIIVAVLVALFGGFVNARR